MLLGCDCFSHDLSILAQIIEPFACATLAKRFDATTSEPRRITVVLPGVGSDAKILPKFPPVKPEQQ
jgi:hypothetical protein